MSKCYGPIDIFNIKRGKNLQFAYKSRGKTCIYIIKNVSYFNVYIKVTELQHISYIFRKNYLQYEENNIKY